MSFAPRHFKSFIHLLSTVVTVNLFQGLYFAGLFLFLNAKYDKAREYIDRMLKMAPASVEVRW